MKLNFTVLIIIFFASFFYTKGQDVNFANFPEDLKKDANAIVRFKNSEFIVNSPKDAKYHVKYAITVLNKNGDQFANLYIYP